MHQSSICHLLQTTPAATDLLPTRTHFELVTTFEDDGHLLRYLLRCKRCGQLYFYEFYEEIDWEGGDDPQYTTYIPVNSPEEAEVLSAKSPFELLMVTPRLQFDIGKGKSGAIRWVGKKE